MLLEPVLRFLFPDPARCFLCGASTSPSPLCSACASGFHLNQGTLHPKVEHVGRVFALAPYRGGVRKKLHALKYWDRPAFARNFAQAVCDLSILTERYDLVTAVPMHRRRFIQRGYNQAELLATEIAARQRTPFRQILKRVHDTRPQHLLGRMARQENLAHAFTLTDRVEGMRVLIVDDILTTGSTLGAAASLLVTAKVNRVDALVVAVSLANSAGQ